MPRITGVASGRIVSAVVTLVAGAGLALYQLTSLVLGPVSSRQLDLSLTVPVVEVQDLSESMPSNPKIVVYTLAAPAAPVSRPTRTPAPTRAATAPTPKPSSRPLPTVAPSPQSHPAGKKLTADD